MRPQLAVVCVFSLLMAAATAVPLTAAQAPGEEHVLHDYIPSISAAEKHLSARVNLKPASGSAAAGSGTSPRASEDLPTAARERAPAPSAQGFRPDRQTALEGGLDYYEAFDPAIAPFKRVTAFDDVRLDVDGKTPVLGVHDTELHILPLTDAGKRTLDRQPRDAFVGELDVDFRRDQLQPLPSVSPESRVYSVSTTPQVNVQIERDGADNFFIRARGPVPETPVHVRFQTDAPRSYFGSEVPALPLRDLHDVFKVPALDASIERRAKRFAAELGITPKSDLRSALHALTQHFRNFVESSEAPDNSGDLYLDLCHSQKGLCRHRAYGFVVTARALGIPARFVQNEAHSWVEVALPDVGYVRIDLGGATHGLTAHAAGERQSYVPMQPDTLPRPEAYRQSYAQAARQAPRTAAGNASEAEVLASLSGRWLSDESLMGPANATPNGVPEQAAQRSGVPPKQAVHIGLEDRRVTALRGGKLVLTGQLLDDAEAGVPGLRVEIWILQPTRHQRMLLAVQVSDQDGYFRADFGVPPDLSVGDYRLIARSQGDATHLPASTE